MSEQPDSLSRFTIDVEVLPQGVPAAVVVRRWLKWSWRVFKIRNRGLGDSAAQDPEVERLRRLNLALAERVAAASEVLARVAQRMATAAEVRQALAEIGPAGQDARQAPQGGAGDAPAL